MIRLNPVRVDYLAKLDYELIQSGMLRSDEMTRLDRAIILSRDLFFLDLEKDQQADVRKVKRTAALFQFLGCAGYKIRKG